LHANEFTGFQGQYFGKFEIGDLVEYDAERNKLKKYGRKTYQWKDYTVESTSVGSITLRSEQGEKLILQGNYARLYRTGDLVKYDAINNIIKKRKRD
jgi:hypothetical protein